MTYQTLAKALWITAKTARRWVNALKAVYYCFLVRPWSKNISRSLIKEPKIYLYDWSLCNDLGARAENFVAQHLLKAVHYWTDHGLGDYGLYYLRDKDKREVDFLVTRNDKPWFLAEVKNGSRTLSPHLEYFQKMTGAEHAFQICMDLDYVDRNCFSYHQPIVVPAITFLSQLI